MKCARTTNLKLEINYKFYVASLPACALCVMEKKKGEWQGFHPQMKYAFSLRQLTENNLFIQSKI